MRVLLVLATREYGPMGAGSFVPVLLKVGTQQAVETREYGPQAPEGQSPASLILAAEVRLPTPSSVGFP